MTDVIFPAELAKAQDSRYFKIAIEDKSVKGDLEGGYTHARPRTTRPARKTYTTGYTDIPQSICDQLEAFFEKVGCYQSFIYTHPVRKTEHKVRFKAPFSIDYKGQGVAVYYTVTKIEIVEV